MISSNFVAGVVSATRRPASVSALIAVLAGIILVARALAERVLLTR